MKLLAKIENRLTFPWTYVIAFFGTLLLASFATIWISDGSEFPSGGDASQYAALGRSLATGQGYHNTVGPWPKEPAYDRMPTWPAMIAVVMMLAPGLTDTEATRLAGVLVLSAIAAVFVSLGSELRLKPVFALIAALAVSLSPSIIYLSIAGLSEPSMVLFVALGAVLLLRAEALEQPLTLTLLSGLCIGLAALVRSNVVLLPLFVLMLGVSVMRRQPLWRGATLTVWFLCALLPVTAWVARNYAITGRPVLSSHEGETLYGANNELTAGDPIYLGSWVMPDQIPGEIPKMQLARQLGSDLALSDYYRGKALQWITQNPSRLPALILQKLLRGLAPKVLSSEAIIAFAHRVLFVALALATFFLWWRQTRRTYLVLLIALAAVYVLTTVIFYGAIRWTHTYVEVFVFPLGLLGLQEYLTRHPARPHTI